MFTGFLHCPLCGSVESSNVPTQALAPQMGNTHANRTQGSIRRGDWEEKALWTVSSLQGQRRLSNFGAPNRARSRSSHPCGFYKWNTVTLLISAPKASGLSCLRGGVFLPPSPGLPALLQGDLTLTGGKGETRDEGQICLDHNLGQTQELPKATNEGLSLASHIFQDTNAE